MKKFGGILILLAVVALAVFFYLRFYFVFGEGVKSGELNYVVYKGVLFKTYEGKLIQSGLRSKTAGTVQSYEFEFSVENPELGRHLMLMQGGHRGQHRHQTRTADPVRTKSGRIPSRTHRSPGRTRDTGHRNLTDREEPTKRAQPERYAPTALEIQSRGGGHPGENPPGQKEPGTMGVGEPPRPAGAGAAGRAAGGGAGCESAGAES